MPGEAIIQQVKNVLTRELTITSATATAHVTSGVVILTGPTTGNLIGWTIYLKPTGTLRVEVRLDGTIIAGYGSDIISTASEETVILPGNGLKITSSSDIFVQSVGAAVSFAVSIYSI